jgi:hypothetical protein
LKIYAYASVFICLVFNGFAQGKHYKNQINRTLKENKMIEKRVEIKETNPINQPPKYQATKPNIIWVDTLHFKSPSYKQHGGRPN